MPDCKYYLTFHKLLRVLLSQSDVDYVYSIRDWTLSSRGSVLYLWSYLVAAASSVFLFFFNFMIVFIASFDIVLIVLGSRLEPFSHSGLNLASDSVCR